MQIVRAFSGFQYMSGQRGNIAPSLNMVPCTPARRNRQAAMIQRNASENTMLSVPQITVDMTNFEPDRERMQNPNHVDSVHATERAVDPITGEYLNTRGTSVTIERLMPRPFVMTVQVDIWTSTLDQKHQLMEQINTIIFPGFDIQNSDNPLDWSALTTVTFESQQWTSISIPIGTENEIDVATINLKVPIWLTPPAMMHRQTLIEQIVTNINSAERDDNGVIIPTNELAATITTPGNHSILINNGLVTLLNENSAEHDLDGQPYRWEDLFNAYGATLRPSETRLMLRREIDNPDLDIVGTLQPTANSNVLSWQPELMSLPQSTIAGIDAIINPLYTFPGEGQLPSGVNGQRYLIKGDLAGPSLAWGDITARDGSIIQFQNGVWEISFDSSLDHGTEYVTNRMTGNQLKWNTEISAWVMAIDGIYQAGQWRLGFV
jgi:hypothetical protein